MIRGVSRQIIEVQETGNVYYEKAYLIVNPEFAGADREVLEREARKVIKSMGAPSGMKKANRVWHWVWRLGVSAAIGAGIMALCIFLF